MNFLPKDHKLTTANLLDAIRRGQVFRVWVESMHYGTLHMYRIFAEVIRRGEGLEPVLVTREDQHQFESLEEAQQALLRALEGHPYYFGTHINDKQNGTLCRRPHKGGTFGPPRTVRNGSEIESDPDKCVRCWVIWHARQE
nr:hypothetical protein 3 [Saccharospirillaceae bacterium]